MIQPGKGLITEGGTQEIKTIAKFPEGFLPDLIHGLPDFHTTIFQRDARDYFFRFQPAINIPFAFRSWGQR